MMMVDVQGDPSDIAFYFELLDFYRANRRKINKKIHITSESDILDFCGDQKNLHWNSSSNPFRRIKYENLCKLSLIFSNILGKQMPDHIHNRMILGKTNQWVREYISYINKIKPYRFFNTNPNFFKLHKLSSDGYLVRMQLK